jgi:hypothetical protein
MTKRTAADDFSARVRDDLIRECDVLQSKIDDAVSLARRLALERRRDRIVKAINAMDAMTST